MQSRDGHRVHPFMGAPRLKEQHISLPSTKPFIDTLSVYLEASQFTSYQHTLEPAYQPTSHGSSSGAHVSYKLNPFTDCFFPLAVQQQGM